MQEVFTFRQSVHYFEFQTKALWDWAIPLIKTAVNNLTVSTLSDWSAFFTNVSVSETCHFSIDVT